MWYCPIQHRAVEADSWLPVMGSAKHSCAWPKGARLHRPFAQLGVVNSWNATSVIPGPTDRRKEVLRLAGTDKTAGISFDNFMHYHWSRLIKAGQTSIDVR